MIPLKFGAGLGLAAAFAISAGPAFADEGMWTYDNFPTAKVNAAYGLKLDQPWLDRVQAALETVLDRAPEAPTGRRIVAARASARDVSDLNRPLRTRTVPTAGEAR